MSILFSSIAYGPIHSRRLGVSLGVNLLPLNRKFCSFECIYCECGFSDNTVKAVLPSREDVDKALRDKLRQMQDDGVVLDVLTFAGNGEPTMHPDFKNIILDTIKTRDEFFPNAKISVLSNATMIRKPDVVEALKLVDNNILKLDSAVESTARLIDGPLQPEYSIERQVELIKQFGGDFILQTIFLRGTVDGVVVDNTTKDEVDAWVEIVKTLSPKKIMIYRIDRETPVPTLEKISLDEMNSIADRVRGLGFDVMVS